MKIPHSKRPGARVLLSAGLALLFPYLAPFPGTSAQKSSTKSHKELPKLKADRPVERDLAKDETHSYRIKLHAGEFLQLLAEQRGIDLVLSLKSPDGSTVIEINDQKELNEPEILLAIAKTEGNYRLDLWAAEKEAKSGGYRLAIGELREATDRDRMLVSAEEAVSEADRLRAEKKPESNRLAVEKYKVVLDAWQKLGERKRAADALGALGNLSQSLGDYQQSLDYFNQALALSRALGDRKGEADALANTGESHKALKQHKQALEAYRQALPILRETGNERDEAIVLTNIGTIYLVTGEQPLALETFDKASAAWRKVGDQKEEAGIWVRAGRSYEALKNSAKALEAYSESVKLYRAAGDQAGEASTLLDLGVVNRDAGDNRKALEYFEQALPIWRSLGRKGEEASTHNYLGLVYRTLGDKQSALDHYNLALGLARELNNKAREATVLNNIASVYYYYGDKRKAIEAYTEILPLRRQTQDRVGEASTLNNLGASHADLGENQRALDYYDLALPIWRDLKRVEEVSVLQNIGERMDRLGEKQKALDYYNQALTLARTFGAKQTEGIILTNLAATLFTLGEKEQARDLYLQSLEIHRATGDATAEATTLRLLGLLHFEMDEKQKALEYLNRVLPLWRQLKDKRGEAITLTTTAAVYRTLNEHEKSLAYSNQALVLHRDVGNRAGEAETLINIGLILSASGERQKAIDNFTRAVELSQAINDPALEAKGRYEIARVCLDTENFEESRNQIEDSLRIIETMRTKVTSQELRASYFATVQKYYDLYIELLMRMHNRESGKGFDARALQASERARARSLMEILAEANANIREGVNPALIDRERTLQQQLNGKADAMARLYAKQAPTEQIEALKKEFDALNLQFGEVRAEIRRTSPRYAALTQPAPLDLKEIQQQVLDDDTLLLEYSLGDERSYLWAVTPSKITSYVLPPRAVIEAAARQTHELLSKPNQAYLTTREQRRLKHEKNAPPIIERNTRAIEAFYSLSQMLLKPVANELGAKRLLVVTSGALQYVPFAALAKPATARRGGGAMGRRAERTNSAIPLIVDHEIVSLPSASTLAVLRHETAGRQAAPKMLAVLADPVFEKDDERIQTRSQTPAENNDKNQQGAGHKDTSKPSPATGEEERLFKHIKDKSGPMHIARLLYTRQEAERILALAPESERKQALDFNASRKTAMADDLGQYRYIHFATHGFLDSERPELSALVLSLVDEKGEQQSGFLYSHEVYNLKLPAEVIVLSACETGLGKEIKGEGLVGLTRGFMYAGSPRVVVSLWSVSDRATSELMAKFYYKMLRENLRPAEALRAVQIEMWKNHQWSDPYYWAAFALQGEWR